MSVTDDELHPMPDAIDAAIERAEAAGAYPVQLSIGVGERRRPVVLIVPSDLDGDELMELIGWLAIHQGFRTMFASTVEGSRPSGLVALDGTAISSRR